MHTCRFCRSYEPLNHLEPIRYSVRHHAHPDCLLKAKGAAAFDGLHNWQLRNFPAMAAHRAGLLDDLRKRIGA